MTTSFYKKKCSKKSKLNFHEKMKNEKNIVPSIFSKKKCSLLK